MEVDTPHLIPFPSLDPNIELFQVEDMGFLHSSPEYAMKRLLAHYKEDIYQLGHVFRKDEKGKKHLSEFMMAEWYRIGFSFEEMIEETAAFCFLFLPRKEIEYLSYREAFLKVVSIDPFTASKETLEAFLQKQAIDHPFSEKDDLLDLIVAYYIEPRLGKDRVSVLYHYPASQAALAKKQEKEYGEVALRFEIYYQGVELANGYDEVEDEKELRNRFIAENSKREKMGKQALPLDELFLSSLSSMPSCCGVSVGVDRLFMLALGKSSIQEVIPLLSNTSAVPREKSYL